MKKLTIFYSFLITSFMAISGILSAQNYTELITAILFSPLAFYFAILMIPRRRKAIIDMDPVLDIIPDKIKTIKNNDYDPERRKFLKLIGAAGGSLFLMTLFTKKTEAAFFGSMPGPGTIGVKNSSGSLIDPSEKYPTDGYNIAEVDDSLSDTYYGYINKDGAWFIRKESSTGAYRYAKGSSDFSTNWTGRVGLTYDYFNVVF